MYFLHGFYRVLPRSRNKRPPWHTVGSAPIHCAGAPERTPPAHPGPTIYGVGAPAPPTFSHYFKSASGLPIYWLVNPNLIKKAIHREAGGRLEMSGV